jgi:ParB/RepB/Spo0J family partition protein
MRTPREYPVTAGSTTDYIVADTIEQLPLAELHESPFNPRKTFTAVDELAASIQAEGLIHQPLLVRRRMPNPTAARAEDMFDGYEVVFGHRRLRAARLAGLTHAPCMVRTLSDEAAARAQIAENLARADLHPIEEAEGYQALIDTHRLSIEQLIAQTGKSRTVIYGRLKLLNAIPQVRQACLAGDIGAEVALLLARIHGHKLQAKALASVRTNDHGNMRLEDGGQSSYRRIREFLRERYTLNLKEAIFDTVDAFLLPDAGACTTCPKRSANAPEYADLIEERKNSYGQPIAPQPNQCTDPDCFEAKKKAHLANRSAELAAKGKTVIVGNKARAIVGAYGDVKGGYIPLKDVRAQLKAAADKKPAKGKAVPAEPPKPTIITVQNPRDGKTIEVVKADDPALASAGVKVKVKAPAADSRAAYAERERQEQEQRTKRIEQGRAEYAFNSALLTQVRQAVASRARDEFDLQLVARTAFAGVGYQDRAELAMLWNVTGRDSIDKRIGQMNTEDLTRFILDCALVRNVGDGRQFNGYGRMDEPTNLLQAAAHYGIDVKAARAAHEAQPVQASALPKPKPGKKASHAQQERAQTASADDDDIFAGMAEAEA